MPFYAAAFSLSLLLLEIRFPWIDPVAIPLPGPVDIRWYGLMYLVGFTIAYFVLRKLSREDFLRLDAEKIGDLLTALVLGLLIGARLGYILFYDFQAFAQNPARILRVWEGGLSFHGGFIGVVIATAWFARKHGVTLLNLGDSLTLAAPFGIFAVRVANFINGELFGRVASPDVPWAMRFPTDPVALRLLEADRLPLRQREEAIGRAYETGLWDRVREQVPLRHPSQLYEALAEGLVLGLILWSVYFLARRRGWRVPEGTFGALFLICYGSLRWLMELFRQPDAQFRSPEDPLGTVLGPLTMGQTLSTLMIVAGLVLLWWIFSRKPAPRPQRVRAR
ncbi:MAG TPA: prolipoprotein diacylglyceryl transferase [Longimicrobiaceae bacterium]|nr:prolipoprotein diacylglyceryl transferase [Longimicrobiaceae bacterium]